MLMLAIPEQDFGASAAVKPVDHGIKVASEPGAKAAKAKKAIPAPPRKDWGKVVSHANGKFIVEVQKDKFEGDVFCLQCRDKEESWDKTGWSQHSFVDQAQVKQKVIQVPFEDKTIGKTYEVRAKVGHPSVAATPE